MAHPLHWTAKSRASCLRCLRYLLSKTHIEEGGSGRSSFSGFFPERGEHGSRVSDNTLANCWRNVGENRDKFYLSPTVCQHVVVSFTHTPI